MRCTDTHIYHLTFTSEHLPQILQIYVHVYLHGVKVLPIPELTLREGEVQLSLSAVPVDWTQALHEPPLHQVLVVPEF